MKYTALLAVTFCAAAWAGPDDSFLLRNATVHPVSQPKIENCSILVIDGKITEINPKIVTKLKLRIIDAKGLHVYPGLIDSGSPIGLTEIGSVRETNDTGELGDFDPQLHAIIAVNPDSEHIPVVRANGITASIVLPGALGGRSPAIIGGQASLIHLDGWTWEQMAIRRSTALQMFWPVVPPVSLAAGPGSPPRSENPTTYAEAHREQELQLRKLDEFFEGARRYQTAKAAGDPQLKPNLRFEAMLPVLEGKLPVMVYAAREREIRETILWAAKQKVRLILAGVRRPGASLAEIVSNRIPVILGSTFAAPLDEDDPYDSSFTLPGELVKAGVKIAFASFGIQFARNLPYEAARAVPFGLSYDEALRSVTLNPAEIWGIDAEYGSIDVGKYADMIVTDGDPLDVRTNVKMVFVKGASVSLETRHTRLYEKYLARP